MALREMPACAVHCGFMPEDLTTLAHFSISSARIFPNSAGEPGSSVTAGVREPRSHLGIGVGGVDRAIERVDDLGGRVARHADAGHRACLVALHRIAHGREFGQRVRALRGASPPARAASRRGSGRSTPTSARTSCPPARPRGRAAPARRRRRALPSRRRRSSAGTACRIRAASCPLLVIAMPDPCRGWPWHER